MPRRHGRHPPPGAVRGGPAGRGDRRDLPRLSRRAAGPRPRAPSGHHRASSAGSGPTGWWPSRRSATGTGSTPATPTIWPPARRRPAPSIPTPATPSPSPSSSTSGLEPHTVPELWIMATERADRAVDATAQFDRKLAALRSPPQPGGRGRAARRDAPGLDVGDRPRRRPSRRQAGRGVPGGGHHVSVAGAVRRGGAGRTGDGERVAPALGRAPARRPRGPGAHRDGARRGRLGRGGGAPRPRPAAARGGSFAGLVVLGGPMGVHDIDAHPWLAPERALIGEVARAGRPVLGVCLGAQQLAAALGAEVTTGPEPEIGLGRVQLTPSGRTDPVFGPEYGGLADPAIPCVHWHQDTFSLPAGAVHLAATARYPHQAFRWGARPTGSSSTSRSTGPRPGVAAPPARGVTLAAPRPGRGGDRGPPGAPPLRG